MEHILGIAASIIFAAFLLLMLVAGITFIVGMTYLFGKEIKERYERKAR